MKPLILYTFNRFPLILVFCRCPTCGKKFAYRKSMETHKNIHSASFICEVCGAKKASQYLLTAHLQTHLPTQERQLTCSKCNVKSYASKSSLRRHEAECGLTAEERKKFPCTQCDKKFGEKSALRSHVHNIHENPGQFVCQRCGAMFNTRGALHRHVCQTQE